MERGNRKALLRKLGGGRKREGGSGGGGDNGRQEKNMREWDAQEMSRTVREKKERDTLIEGAIKELSRNMALGKFPGIHKNDPRL